MKRRSNKSKTYWNFCETIGLMLQRKKIHLSKNDYSASLNAKIIELIHNSFSVMAASNVASRRMWTLLCVVRNYSEYMYDVQCAVYAKASFSEICWYLSDRIVSKRFLPTIYFIATLITSTLKFVIIWILITWSWYMPSSKL